MLAPTIHQDSSELGGRAWENFCTIVWVATGLAWGVGLPGLAAEPVVGRPERCLSTVAFDDVPPPCTVAVTKDRSAKETELFPPKPQLAPAEALPLPPDSDGSSPSAESPTLEIAPSALAVDIAPEIIESSPVLQRWLEEVPDVSVDIQHDPAFRTRVRVGYSQFPSAAQTGGFYVGVQDVFVGRTPLTLSAEYSVNSTGDRELFGADAQYYLLPLGWYGNVAPVLGYRAIDNATFYSEGVNVGLRIVLIPSRTGAADLSLTQSWVAPGTEEEVGLTTFSAGYAIAEDLRIGTDIQTQNTRDRQESRVSLLLEWML